MKGLIRWDPFKAATRWDPWTELREMQSDMDKLCDRYMGKEAPISEKGYAEWLPTVESYMKGKDLVFKCELPGVDPKDVDVSFDEKTRQLIVKGERKQETDAREEDYLYREFRSEERRV